MDTKSALEKIRNDASLSHKFVNDPKGTLEGMGVDTSPLVAKAKANGSTAVADGCTGVGGCGVCGSHG